MLTVGHLGRSSLRLDYRVQGPAGDERARGSTTWGTTSQGVAQFGWY